MRHTALVFHFVLLAIAGSTDAGAQERRPAGTRSNVPADVFADVGARDLVLSAFALRDSAAAGLASYEATATERMHVGLQITRRLPLRSRTLYHREQVARVYWRQDGRHVVRWLGRREGTPTVGDDWSEHAPFGMDFDIAEELDLDDIQIDLLFDPLGDRMDVFDGEFVQPVSAEGLTLYRFSSGDTMQIRLPDRTITLVEVVVRPRNKDWETVEGSLWFDRDTGVLARAAYRPGDVWDMEVREPGDLDDVPGFLKPAIGTVNAIVIEYGLYEQHWWLPRRVLAEGVFDWGNGLVRMPLVLEWTMRDHVVNEAAGPAVTPGPELRTVGLRRITYGDERRGRTVFLVERGFDLASAPDLPPPIADVELIAFTRAELDPMIARIEDVAGPPQLPGDRPVPGALLYSLRYDRVRGPSVGLGRGFNTGRTRIHAGARFALALPELFGEVAATRGALTATAYHRLDDASDWNVADGLGNTAMTLLFGHDGGDYYRATGVSLGTGGGGSGAAAKLEVFHEYQHPVARQTSVSLATIGGGSLRPNIGAETVTLTGARAEIAGQLGADVQGAVFNWRLRAEAATGDVDYGRVAASVRLTGTVRERLATALELGAGLAGNGAPVQRNFHLGGVATLRGVPENSVTGPAFWMARAEAGTAVPGMRAALFVDIGWAGARDGIARSRPTAGTGVGASFMDGLFRVDLARGIVRSDAWRFYFYLDALL